jgi:hypothetical protein
MKKLKSLRIKRTFRSFAHTFGIGLLFLLASVPKSNATLLRQVSWNDLYIHSGYIFEGTVVSTSSYTGSDGNVYTSNIVHIHKQLHGSLTCGNVEIITEGGTADGTTEYIADALTLYPNASGIFFCNVTSYPLAIVHGTTDNTSSYEVYSNMQGVVMYDTANNSGDTLYHWYWYDLPDIHVLYNQISALTGYTYSNCDIGKREHHKTDSISSTYYLAFSFGKVRIWDSIGNSYVGFDVLVDDTATTPTYLDHGEFVIGYNSVTFDPGGAANTNVTWPNANYTSTTSGGGNVHVVYTSTHYTDRLSVTNKLAVLCRIRMSVTTCTSTSKTGLYPYLGGAVENYYALGSHNFGTGSGGDMPIRYNAYFAGTGQNVKACSFTYPHIDSITETSLTKKHYFAGGIGQEIDIWGGGFGAHTGDANVRFSDKENSASEVSLDSAHYVTWSGTKIQVIVPSNIADAFGSLKNAVVTSGHVTVNTSSNNTVRDTINIRYSVLNQKNATNHKYYPVDMRNGNGSGGYTLKLNSSDFSGHWQNKNCLYEAARLWGCATGVNFTASTTYTANKYNTVGHTDNTVSFGHTPNGVISWSYLKASTPCTYALGAVNNYHYPITQMDIVIDSNSRDSIWADPHHNYPIPGQKYDLETIFEHEIGHGMGLNHTANANDMMRFGLKPGEIRIIHANDIAGGNYQVTGAAATWSGSCASYNPMSVVSCSSLGIENENAVSYAFTVSPNPFSGETRLHHNWPQGAKSFLTVTDMQGKTVYENSAYLEEDNSVSDFGFLKPGVYLLKAVNKYGAYTVKINKL